ncbi:MAG: helix-turn-helix domain-containing protein [Planctomycetaceae bacterium]
MKQYTIKQIAGLAGVHPRTVRAWIDEGELRAVNLSRSRTSAKPRLRILESDWQAFLASRTTAPTEKPAPRRRSRVGAGKEWF